VTVRSRLLPLLAAALVAALFAPVPAAAQPVAAGPPFVVSQAGVSTTPGPVVAVGPRGEAVLLWIGECPEFGLCARAYDATGQPLADAATLATSNTLFAAVPAAALGADGELVLVWSRSGLGFERQIVGRRYGLDGAPLGAEVTIASASAQVFDRPALAVAPDGDLLVAFEKLRFDGYVGEGEERIPVYTGVEIRGRRLAPDLVPRGAVFRIDGAGPDVVGRPTVAAAAGTFLAAWESYDFATGRESVLWRRFAPAAGGGATPAGDEAPVASTSSVRRGAPSAAASEQGTFLVAWEESGPGVVPAVRAQVFDAAGARFPAPFQLGTGDDSAPRAAGGDDLFAAVWASAPAGAAPAIRARRWNHLGVPLDDRFRIDTAALGTPLTPDLGVFGGAGTDSGLVVGWTLRQEDFDRQVLARRYAGVLPPPEPCSDGPQTLCLGAGDRFEVHTTWATTKATGAGQRHELTDDTGYFWFFKDTNVETVVKVLDGCGVNGHFWVFAAGLTNVEVSLTVRDTANDARRSYHNDQGDPFQPIQDTAAFACN